jgi:trk system potassium uptake protein TrkH
MIAGALPFKVYFITSRERFRKLFKNPVLRLILALTLVASSIVILNLYLFNHYTLVDAARFGGFSTVSGLTSTGLQNSSFQWVPLPIIIIMLLMLIGGSSGSTSGGIKVDRILLGYEGLIWWFKRLFVRGSVMIPFKHEGRNIPVRISELELSKNMLIILLYLLTVFIAVILALHLAPTQLEIHEVTFEVISAVGNNGMGYGYVTAASPMSVKWLFIFVMWIGRLEIIPVLILVMGLIRGFEPK